MTVYKQGDITNYHDSSGFRGGRGGSSYGGNGGNSQESLLGSKRRSLLGHHNNKDSSREADEEDEEWFGEGAEEGLDGEDGDEDMYSFIGSFPASAPYVTAVGGTEGGLVQDEVGTTTGETAWLYSGGGFSIYFPTPDWQQEAVSKYLDRQDITFPVCKWTICVVLGALRLLKCDWIWNLSDFVVFREDAAMILLVHK